MASTNSFHQFLVHILSKGRSGLIADYKTFKRVAEPGTYEAWCLPENYDNKNRYINVVCLDTTRVKLNDQDVNNDYIHANHIRIPHYPIAYIAAQGPLESTVVDFYRMIIQERVAVIVMLTDMDHISYKCHPYFSCDEGLVTRFGPFDVLRTEVEIQHGFQLSVLEVFDHRDNRIHRINHCWFRDWPEFHVPDAEDFVNFFASINQSKFGLNLAEKTSNQLGPVLVHCAGGVGRTGCYIAIDICSRQLVSEGRCPDVFDVVGTLRDLRMHSVEREEQYLFIHLVVSYFGFANKLACDDDHITFDQVKHILNIE